MRILFYADSENDNTARLRRVIAGEIPHGRLEIYQTVRELAGRLSQRSSDVNAIALLTSSEKDLLDLLSIRELLLEHRVILILQEADDKIVTYAHTLRPRYVSFANGDFSDVSLVLGKMLSAHRTQMA